MLYAIIVLIVVVGGWTEWRFRQLGQSQAGPLFPCYYCGHMYPVFRREQIGHYDYCPAHGHRRKAAWLADFRREEVKPNDNGVRVYTTSRRVEQPDNDKLPWIS